MTLVEAQEKLRGLSVEDQVEILEWVWEGLQPENFMQIQERWTHESEERIDAVERGELPTADGPSILKELRRSLEL